jgi:hypothetical protein
LKVIKAKKYGPKNKHEPISITWQHADGQESVLRYSFVRGAVVWPHDDLPGIVLIAGKRTDLDQVCIFEECEFRGLTDAILVFERFWVYLPSVYYYQDIPENNGFVSHVRGHRSLGGKLPFIPTPNPESIDYGNSLIGVYLDKKILIVPPNGVLEKQFQEVQQESDLTQYPAITALRFLLQGIDARPWPFDVMTWDLSSCLA